MGKHEGYQPATRADVQKADIGYGILDALKGYWILGIGQRTPCTEQDTVGTHFHGAAVVPYGEMLEAKIR